ncbi:hypothetical protein P691DRAFT_259922 [Macrolepiota fuliginosa MF-IS2]|uniref:Uncharacterized protein n=1 Tax=Macrolepiota fuliginosa MF-IS2 TaxID=1400762 RepID=A0A9P5X977_9AGAR|nr:hypothetical protein P691DRAFT_259922 [Macrolepiota fuliginosa MF-IS2]
MYMKGSQILSVMNERTKLSLSRQCPGRTLSGYQTLEASRSETICTVKGLPDTATSCSVSSTHPSCSHSRSVTSNFTFPFPWQGHVRMLQSSPHFLMICIFFDLSIVSSPVRPSMIPAGTSTLLPSPSPSLTARSPLRTSVHNNLLSQLSTLLPTSSRPNANSQAPYRCPSLFHYHLTQCHKSRQLVLRKWLRMPLTIVLPVPIHLTNNPTHLPSSIVSTSKGRC